MTATALQADPAIASQAVFRAVMDALARPAEPHALATSLEPPAPLAPAAAAVALALIDYDTPVWLDAALDASPEVAHWLKFETGAPIVADPRRAAFALIADAENLPAFDTFSPGSDEYPDRSTTLVVQVESFCVGAPILLSGPGFAHPRTLSAAPLPRDFARRLAANRALFPRGVDLMLTGAHAVVGLPRSVRVLGGE